MFPAKTIFWNSIACNVLKLTLDYVFRKAFLRKFIRFLAISSCSIETGAGIIDSDFYGSVKVVLYNLSDRKVKFETENKIAQVVFKKVECPAFTEVSDFNDSVTERNKHKMTPTEVRQENKFYK